MTQARTGSRTDADVSFVVERSPCSFAWLSFSRDVMVWAAVIVLVYAEWVECEGRH